MQQLAQFVHADDEASPAAPGADEPVEAEGMAVADGKRGAQGDGAIAVFGAEEAGKDRLRQIDMYHACVAREITAAAGKGTILPHHLVHVQAEARTVLS